MIAFVENMADLDAAIELVGVAHLHQVIGFDRAVDRDNIMQAGIAQFEDFRYLVEKDIHDMVDKFGKRIQAAGKIVFGLGRTKKMVGGMHWVQDCFRASDIPNHEHFDEDVLFEALSLAQIRKSDVELVTTNAKAVDPGKFKDKRKWPEWEKAFVNYLPVVPGVSGIPLSYVVREQDVPTPGIEYPTLTERMIQRAPLCDGRRDMTALRRHYAGEGNSTRRIADAKRIQTTLQYKTERALPFNKFLNSLQRMFTIFEEEDEPLTERAKVDKLLTKVQNTTLAAAVAQLRYQLNTVGISFTVAANHLSSEISQTPDYQLSRKISSVSTNGGGRGGGRNGGRGGRGHGGRGGCGSGKANTGYYSPAEWEKLSFEERDNTCKERDKKDEQGGSKRSISEMTTKQLTTVLISSLQKASEKESSGNDENPKKSNTQAGNAFGACCELDSHTDTCALGSNFVPLHFTGRVCDVSPYNSEAYDAEKNVPIVTAATAYTDQSDGHVYILVIHQGLWFGEKLTHSLINPNQLRYAGVTVHDNPFDTENPISISNDIVPIPLSIMGNTLFVESTTPTQHELENSPHVHLTLDTEWNLHTVRLASTQSAEAETGFCDTEPGLLQISSVYCWQEMAEIMSNQRTISAVDIEARKTFHI
ncbi:Reverse transcriptase (RNA-dependent DNA polymerase) [Fragilaria crotonensis]|nr:Reverse transcriptase (RNA-dependent DNA polymerase) [Fragilaria crotonensis]